MANITVEDIPDELYEQFKETARQDRRTLNEEIIVAMEMLVQQAVPSREGKAALERNNKRRRQRPRNAVDSLALLRGARER